MVVRVLSEQVRRSYQSLFVDFALYCESNRPLFIHSFRLHLRTWRGRTPNDEVNRFTRSWIGGHEYISHKAMLDMGCNGFLVCIHLIR
jgi:hypothetical protein